MADGSQIPGDWLQLLLGGGAVASITAGYKAFKDWREGSWQRKDQGMKDLERWRDENDERRRTADRQADEARTETVQWRNWSADLEHVLRVNGIPIPEGRPTAVVALTREPAETDRPTP